MRGAAVFFSSFCLTHPEFDGRPERRGAIIVPVPTFPGMRESESRPLGRKVGSLPGRTRLSGCACVNACLNAVQRDMR
jgi:hypothetical protein